MLPMLPILPSDSLLFLTPSLSLNVNMFPSPVSLLSPSFYISFPSPPSSSSPPLILVTLTLILQLIKYTNTTLSQQNLLHTTGNGSLGRSKFIGIGKFCNLIFRRLKCPHLEKLRRLDCSTNLHPSIDLCILNRKSMYNFKTEYYTHTYIYSIIRHYNKTLH